MGNRPSVNDRVRLTLQGRSVRGRVVRVARSYLRVHLDNGDQLDWPTEWCVVERRAAPPPRAAPALSSLLTEYAQAVGVEPLPGAHEEAPGEDKNP